MAYLVMPLEFLAEVCDDRLLDRKVRLPFFFDTSEHADGECRGPVSIGRYPKRHSPTP